MHEGHNVPGVFLVREKLRIKTKERDDSFGSELKGPGLIVELSKLLSGERLRKRGSAQTKQRKDHNDRGKFL